MVSPIIHLIGYMMLITARSQPAPTAGLINPNSESHTKLDNLIHATSHKVLEAQAAGQALKELERNIENHISWSAHNIATGIQTMPFSGRSLFELQQNLNGVQQLTSMLSTMIEANKGVFEKKPDDQISKLNAQNEDLRHLLASLQALSRISDDYFSRKALDNSSIIRLSYAVPNLFQHEVANWIAFAIFEILLISSMFWLRNLADFKKDNMPFFYV